MCKKAFLDGKEFKLTAEEMAAIGPEAKPVIYYCAQCLNVAENLQSGAQILKGLYERQLRARGVINAGEVAEQYHKRLLEAATRKLQ
jgi:hypothetical protein